MALSKNSKILASDVTGAIKSITRSGTTFTYTTLGGSTGTFTQQDNNTTYSAGTGISISSNKITNTGVTSVNGQTGAVTVGATSYPQVSIAIPTENKYVNFASYISNINNKSITLLSGGTWRVLAISHNTSNEYQALYICRDYSRRNKNNTRNIFYSSAKGCNCHSSSITL